MNFAHLHKKPALPPVFLAAVLLLAGAGLFAADAPAGAPFVFTPPKEGEVLSPAMREKLLAQIKGFLDRTSPEQLAQLKDAANPFIPKLPPAPEPVATTTSAAPNNTPPAPVQLSSAEKLQQVADQLKPSGALIGGQSRLIIFANGDTLAVGQAIHVTFPGDSAPTEILLQEVSADTFTLKLGDTAKSFPFVAKESTSRPNSSTPTPEPKKP